MKIQSIHIEDEKVLKNLDISFRNEDKILDTVVIAGSNGSGKTTLLKVIYSFFQNKSLFISKKNNLEIFFENENLNFLQKLDLSFWDILHSWNSYQNNYPNNSSYKEMKNNFSILPKVIYVPTEINFEKLETKTSMFSKEYSFLNIVDSNVIHDIPSYIASRVTYLANTEENMTMKEVREKVSEEINEIFNILDLDVKLIGLSRDEKSTPLFQNSTGAEFDINELSSGEKQLFLRTLAIKMLDPEDSIILIDEPEISLHPKWQQKIVKVYEKIGKNNQIIIATHSPHILGSVPKENIILLSKNDNGEVQALTKDNLYDSFGQPVNRILIDIMGLETTRNPEVHFLLKGLREMVDKNQYNSAEFIEKYKYARKILGNTDEDLLLIDMDIQIRKKRGN